ncbi:MAG: hypothetical protein ACR2ID_07195 [Chthoniobacterales bacterium]
MAVERVGRGEQYLSARNQAVRPPKGSGAAAAPRANGRAEIALSPRESAAGAHRNSHSYS